MINKLNSQDESDEDERGVLDAGGDLISEI